MIGVIVPLVLQLFGPGPLTEMNYVAGNQWTTPFGAFTATNKTIYLPQGRFLWGRMYYIWEPGSMEAKVRLIARDANYVQPDLVLGEIDIDGPSAGNAVNSRLEMPDASCVTITDTLNQLIDRDERYFYVNYQVQDDGVHPQKIWEARLEMWIQL